ncbi:efflux RND transporter periplasmic adaptor subunit [Pedobacter nototheniae]|uniref:efflux RND transporter periplasmic adaptor subunit n=1 Tax=Pedobacter nototheniae TaxID=2488994 RepID=UPI00292D54B8|nr:efflux RND transporter periplasmic adaptor subunit [Pedobacter nototheniae]
MIRNKIQVKNTLKFLSLLALSILLSSCGGKQAENQQQAPLKADFITLEPTSANLLKKYPGTIEGSVNVDIKAQVSGYLEQIYVKEGDYVNKGQTLFRIKGDVFNEQVTGSQASLKAALAAQATAKIELEKIKPLVEGKVVSPLQLETAQAQYESASAQVSQARAALGSSKINANFAIIKAPVSGYIGRIPNRIGNLVTPADATPLTSLSEINKVFVYFSMSESDFITYAKDKKSGATGNKVEVIMADGTVYNQVGELEMASGNIDQSTGTMALKAVFPNPDKILRSGGSARIILSKNLNSSLLVPMASVKDIQDKFFVFALGDSNKVEMKPIEIAGRSGNDYILKSGINPGEKIAINSIDILNHGMSVTPNLVKKEKSQ